jgi:hypothetical protein
MIRLSSIRTANGRRQPRGRPSTLLIPPLSSGFERSNLKGRCRHQLRKAIRRRFAGRKGPTKIERASRVRPESSSCDDHEDSSAGFGPRMQSSRKRDSSSDRPLKQDSLRCEDARRQTRKMRGAGQPETPSSAQTKKRGNGATREIAKRMRRRIKGQGVTQDLIAGSAEGCGIRGDSNPHSRRSQRNEGPGRLGNSPLASPEGAEIGETRRTTSRRAEEDETSGRPEDSTSARAGR